MKKLMVMLAAFLLTGFIAGSAGPQTVPSLPGADSAVRYQFVDSFANPGSPSYSHFEADVTLLEPAPVKLQKLIGNIVRTQINDFLFSGTKKEMKKFPSGMKNVADMMQSCYGGYRQMYLNDFSGDATAPPYIYYIKVLPVWMSDDANFVSYSFYTYADFGGAHGMFNSWISTFDASTGRLLGYKDFFGKKNYPAVLRLLSAQLKDKRNDYNRRYSVPASEEAVTPAVLSPSGMGGMKLTEKFRGKKYPRPALTYSGMNFSYQPYEEGPYSEGAIFVTVPFDSLLDLMKPEAVPIIAPDRN